MALLLYLHAPWGAEDTDTLLEILKNNDVKATFFLCGYWVDKYPEEVKKIYEAGNDIGNHSNTHPHSSQLSLEENKKNIMECHNKIKALLNIDPILYRPPFGEYNDTVITAAEECNYYPIQWDIDSIETKYKKKSTPKNLILKRAFQPKIYFSKSILYFSLTSIFKNSALLNPVSSRIFSINSKSLFFKDRNHLLYDFSLYLLFTSVDVAILILL